MAESTSEEQSDVPSWVLSAIGDLGARVGGSRVRPRTGLIMPEGRFSFSGRKVVFKQYESYSIGSEAVFVIGWSRGVFVRKNPPEEVIWKQINIPGTVSLVVLKPFWMIFVDTPPRSEEVRITAYGLPYPGEDVTFTGIRFF